MSHPSINTALTTLFAVMAIMIVALSSFALYTMSGMYERTDQFANDRLPKAVMIGEIKFSFNLMRTVAARHLLATQQADTQAETQFAASTAASIDKALAEYEKTLVTEAGHRLFANAKAEIDTYRSMVRDTMLPLRDSGRFEEAKAFLIGPLKDQTEIANNAIGALVSFNLAGSQTLIKDSAASYAKSLWLMIGACGVAVSTAIGSALFARLGISRPINRITDSMKALAGGDTGSPIPYSGRTDEIGAMAEAVEVFRQTALAKVESDNQLEASRSLSERDRLAQEHADHVRAAEMAKATTDLATGLNRLAAGDLSFQLTDAFAADFETLRKDFNTSVSKLCETLAAVTGSVGTISNGSQEISQGANDLAKRTEQQAAALEETAAALDQITVNVSNSSKRAEEARTVAVQANTSAARSGAVVASAVNAMQRIEQSSNQIANIIGVIDEIAFQTNLLALNAGVEAARAGDAGKGFAVVAQEVRELAQRSANAAKEIKDLIRNSTAEVESGVKLVRETGEALKTIEAYVITINQHMDSIATAAREQSIGLAEVNSAVNQMDQTTQQNAAMVEESSAAASSLANESITLRQMINRFNLGNQVGAADPIQALQQTARRMALPPSARTEVVGNAAIAKEWAEF